MKNKLSLIKSSLIISVLFSGLFFSCQLTTPSKISIKTDADFKVPLGKASIDISEYLSTDVFMSKIKESLGNTVSVYDLQRDPDNDTLTFLAHYPMFNIPFDPSEYLSSLDLDSLLGESSLSDINQSIAIPGISKNMSFTKSVTTEAKGFLDIFVPEVSGAETQIFSIKELPSVAATATQVYTMNCDYCEAMKYADGSYIVASISRTDSNALGSGFSAKFKVDVTDAENTYTYKYDGYTTDYVEGTDGCEIKIPLSKGYISKKMNIKITVLYEGGENNTTTHTYKVVFNPKEDVSLLKIINIDYTGGTADTSDDLDDPSLEIPAQTIDVSALPEMFINATVNSGSVVLSAPVPTGWIDTTFSLKDLTLSGAGLDIDENDFVDTALSENKLLKETADLNGQKISKSAGTTITLNGNLKVSCNGATIDLENGDVVDVSAAFNISSFSQVKVDMSSLAFSLDDSGARIDENVTRYVKQIVFNQYKHTSATEVESTESDGFGIQCTVVDSLPEGNSIPLTIASELFGISGSSAISGTIDGTGNSSSVTKKFKAYPTINLTQGVIDFKVGFGSEETIDGTDYTGVVTLTNVDAGSEYTLSVSDVKFLCDWDKVTVNLGDSSKMEGDFSLDSFSITDLLSSLPFGEENLKKLKFGDINMYFYAQRPDAGTGLGDLIGNTIKISGNMGISYKDGDETEKSHYFLGTSASDDEEVTFNDNISWPSDDIVTLTSENAGEFLSNITAEKASFSGNISDILNDTPTDIKMNYKLGINGGEDISLYNYQIEDAKASGGTTISLDMVCELPLELKLIDELDMNLMEMMAMTSGESSEEEGSGDSGSGDSASGSSSGSEEVTDLLGRESAASWEQFAQYADSIEYFRLSYVVNNKVIDGFTGSIRITDEASGLDKEAVFANGAQKLDLTGEEIRRVLTTYPFNPQVSIVIGNGASEADPVKLSVLRSGLNSSDSLGATVVVSIKMDGDTPITVLNLSESNSEGGE